MSSQVNFTDEDARRNYQVPFSDRNPIPTIQKYREHRLELDAQKAEAEAAQHSEEDDSKASRAFSAVKEIYHEDTDRKHPAGEPYPTVNQNTRNPGIQPGQHDSGIPDLPTPQNASEAHDGRRAQGLSATEKAAGHSDPKLKRKEMKHNKRDGGGRLVTDPVTHLPLIIRDSTEKDLRRAPENEPHPSLRRRTATGLSGASKSPKELAEETVELQEDYDGLRKIFPPPSFDDVKAELARTYQIALGIGLGVILSLATLVVLLTLVIVLKPHLDSGTPGLWRNLPRKPIGSKLPDSSPLLDTATAEPWWNLRWKGSSEPTRSFNFFPALGEAQHIFLVVAIAIIMTIILGSSLIFSIGGWLRKKTEEIWDDEVWDAARLEERKVNEQPARLPESVAWLNNMLASIWPLINPDLFDSIADMLEDVMQASLPKIIRMVSVDDLGQGSEAIRILGMRWLPTGAASQSVDENGNLKPAGTMNDDKDHRETTEEGRGKTKSRKKQDSSEKSRKERLQKEQEQKAIREGMKAEQGDFVNLELAFSYRARSSGKSIRSKANNAHLYLKFYLPGGIWVPVWVELRGIIGTMRLRLQLTPDPPFFSVCTLTFLGQPRADISCVPLLRQLPNLMNLPVISSFVQSAIDAALAEYVAPKSLILNLKDMLVGDDFKKDTIARGVVRVYIKQAQNFKEGDAHFGPIHGTTDGYVTCSWGKFGKTLTSTRIIEDNSNPSWHQGFYLLINQQEIDAEEKLRLVLWDSDKFTADDELGRVEVDLKELMHSAKTKGKMCDREDRFRGQNLDELMPGTINWSVGYFPKSRITDWQLSQQEIEPKIRTVEELKDHVKKTAQKKLREATEHDESQELHQQEVQDYKEREDTLICSAPPDPKWPSGILSIQIHNITGLEVESQQKLEKEATEEHEKGAEEKVDDLPSSYCSIILNHEKIYRTRTKPKNARPFFNAGTERFIRDYRNTEVMISVRDMRERENDALLGVIYLPLKKLLKDRSQVMDTYPLVGGIGFGRARVSIIFRSLEIDLPRPLLGWDYGTMEIKTVKTVGDFPSDLQSHRIKLLSNIMHAKMASESGEWRPKYGKQSVFLPYRKRTAMPLVVEFRTSSFMKDSTPAFAVCWLRDIPDEDEQTMTMQVWHGGKENLKRATTCAGYKGLDENESPLGRISVTMRMWRGLSSYHKTYANKKDPNMRHVMEVLDTVNDEFNTGATLDDADSSDTEDETPSHPTSPSTSHNQPPKELTPHTNASSRTSQSSSRSSASVSASSSTHHSPLDKIKDLLHGHNDPDDGSRGPIAAIKDYKDHHKQLHKKQRGVMQWKAARTADWAVGKVREGRNRLSGVFDHKEKTPDLETEI